MISNVDLAAMYQGRIRRTVDEDMAERFQLPVEEAAQIIKRANQSLKRVISCDFTAEELDQTTEGYVTKGD